MTDKHGAIEGISVVGVVLALAVTGVAVVGAGVGGGRGAVRVVAARDPGVVRAVAGAESEAGAGAPAWMSDATGVVEGALGLGGPGWSGIGSRWS